jgi:hypothetical protein
MHPRTKERYGNKYGTNSKFEMHIFYETAAL